MWKTGPGLTWEEISDTCSVLLPTDIKHCNVFMFLENNSAWKDLLYILLNTCQVNFFDCYCGSHVVNDTSSGIQSNVPGTTILLISLLLPQCPSLMHHRLSWMNSPVPARCDYTTKWQKTNSLWNNTYLHSRYLFFSHRSEIVVQSFGRIRMI